MSRKRPTFFILALFVSLQVAAQKKYISKSVFSGVDTAFSRVLKDWHAAGFAVAVVDKDSVIYAKGFGYRDYARKIPVTTNTLFAIGSCTKAFTGALIGMLQKEGKIDIHKPVRDYLPGLKFYNTDMNAHITIRDMLCHRTGLPRYDYSWYLFPTRSRDSLLERIQYFKPTAGVSKRWQYNNFMYVALGALIEKITGKSWEDNVKEELFAPTGMIHSDVSLKAWTGSGEASYGYDVVKDSIIHQMKYYDIMGMSPAGAINSNVLDMSKWLITWIKDGKYKGKQVIPAAYATQAMSAQMIIGPAMPDKEYSDIFLSDYGYAWMISSYRGHYRVEHGGNINGFSASACFFPSDSIGIVVLCNQDGSEVPSVVRDIISDRALHLKYRDWNDLLLKEVTPPTDTAKKSAPPAVGSFHKPTHPLKDYTGNFENKGFGTFKIALLKDSLFALFPNGDKMWLTPKNYDVFHVDYVNPGSGIDTAHSFPHMQFRMNYSGDIGSLEWGLQPGVEPVVFTRKIAVNRALLEKYTGEYAIGKMMMHVTLDKNDHLHMLVPGQPEYELIPEAKNTFSLKGLAGFSIRFELNDQGAVTGLQSVQPNGTFEAKKKKAG